MRRFYLTLFAILAIIVLSSPFSSAYEKELKSISTNMSEKIARAGKKTVAVVDFTDLQGNVTEMGRFVAEEFSVALADMDKGFEVVDRTHLQTLLKEHKLSTTGLIDPSTAKKLGEIAGVDALVTGTITPFGDSVRISIKILDTSTAKVIGASSGEIAKTKAIEDLLARGIETAIPGEIGTASTPSTPQTQQIKAGAKVEMLFFQNDSFKITAKFLKKTDKIIKLVLLYENITEKNVRIRLHDRERYLTDENGERWDIKEIENIGARYGEYTDFPPKLPKMIKLTFSTKDDSNGTIFTAVLDHICEDCDNFQTVIRNIKAE